MEIELQAGDKVLVDYINHKAYVYLDGKSKPLDLDVFVNWVKDNLIVQTGGVDGHWIYEPTVSVKGKLEKDKQGAVQRWLSD
jgi:hypothetical protein